MKRTYLGLASLTLSLAFLGCGDSGSTEDDMGTEGGTEIGDGDGDTAESSDTNDTTGDGDGDTGDGDGDTTGDGDGDTGDGDGDTTGDGDMDMDGVPDASDNCPDDPNPNQLDFDDNGMGNVCDALVFTNVTGTLDTTGTAAVSLFSCDIPIALEVIGGEVQVRLNDDATIAAVDIVSLQAADILDKECDLSLASATVSIKNFEIANNGDPFPVAVPHDMTMHDMGTVSGDSNIPHPVLSTGTLEASVNGDPPMPSDLMLDGSLPTFTLDVSGAGAMGTMSWDAPDFVLAMDTFMIEDPMLNIDFELVGLTGPLTLAP